MTVPSGTHPVPTGTRSYFPVSMANTDWYLNRNEIKGVRTVRYQFYKKTVRTSTIWYSQPWHQSLQFGIT